MNETDELNKKINDMKIKILKPYVLDDEINKNDLKYFLMGPFGNLRHAMCAGRYDENLDDIEQIIFIFYRLNLLYKDEFNTLIKLIKHYIKICNLNKIQYKLNIFKPIYCKLLKHTEFYCKVGYNNISIINLYLKRCTFTKVIKTFSNISNKFIPCNLCNKKTKTYKTCKYKCLTICIPCFMKKYDDYTCVICESKIPILKLTRRNI